MRVLKVSVQEEGQRLDRMLAKYMQLAPRSFFYKMLRKKNIKLNGKRQMVPRRLLRGMRIHCILPMTRSMASASRVQPVRRMRNSRRSHR